MTDDDLGRIAYERWRAEMSTAFTPDRPPWHRLSVVEHLAFIAAAVAVRAAVLPAGTVLIDRETARAALSFIIAYEPGTTEQRLIDALTAALGEGGDGE